MTVRNENDLCNLCKDYEKAIKLDNKDRGGKRLRQHYEDGQFASTRTIISCLAKLKQSGMPCGKLGPASTPYLVQSK